jgi:hypothetical protein
MDEALKIRVGAEDAANRVLQERRQEVQQVWKRAAVAHLDARDALASLPRMDDEIAAAEREVARLKAERERRGMAISEGVVLEVNLVGALNSDETVRQAMLLEKRRRYDAEQQANLAGWAAAIRRHTEEGMPTLASAVELYVNERHAHHQTLHELVEERRRR